MNRVAADVSPLHLIPDVGVGLGCRKVGADSRRLLRIGLPMNRVAADVSPLHLIPDVGVGLGVPKNWSRLTSAATVQRFNAKRETNSPAVGRPSRPRSR